MKRILPVAALCCICLAGVAFPEAKRYAFDGFALGDNYAEKAMSRAPYDGPCDNDPIDNRARRFMVYGGLPCRERVFPEKTTVMFYLKFSETDEYAQPIEAFAWLYGGYFNGRTDFPLRPGDSLEAAKKKLGAPSGTFAISRKKSRLTVHVFAGDVYVLCIGRKIIGFVVGPMPPDPENEQWRGLMQMYDRYTPKE